MICEDWPLLPPLPVHSMGWPWQSLTCFHSRSSYTRRGYAAFFSNPRRARMGLCAPENGGNWVWWRSLPLGPLWLIYLTDPQQHDTVGNDLGPEARKPGLNLTSATWHFLYNLEPGAVLNFSVFICRMGMITIIPMSRGCKKSAVFSLFSLLTPFHS